MEYNYITIAFASNANGKHWLTEKEQKISNPNANLYYLF